MSLSLLLVTAIPNATQVAKLTFPSAVELNLLSFVLIQFSQITSLRSVGLRQISLILDYKNKFDYIITISPLQFFFL